MSQTLDQFVAEVEADIKAFAAQYQAEHAADPERYPLELGDENSGLWLEFFVDFMSRANP
ncbi:hypothetical protein R3Q56_004182 [Pseudomonas aeruginosa]|jgi:hypothetical protein|nr:hypothetical protein [Pseudomonas aeruginosa]